MKRNRWLISSLALTALVMAVAACGDDPKSEGPPAEKTGVLRVTVGLTNPAIKGVCYDVAIRNGANATVATRQRACVAVPDELTFDETCSAEPGRLTHTVSVNLVALWVDGETPYDPSVAGAADLGLVDNPCANGCSVQVSCVENATREAKVNLTVMAPSVQGFIDLAVNGSLPDYDYPARSPTDPVALREAPMICYGLDITDGLGDAIGTPRVLCASRVGDGAASVAFVTPCDARTGRTSHRVAVSLVGVFREIPENFDDLNPGPGVKAEYGFSCADNCVQTITCARNNDVPVTFEPTIRRVYIPGTFDISVANTVSGEGSEAVAGGCYSIDVTSANGDALIGQAGLCSAFNPGTEGGAGLGFSGPCDSTPYTDGGTGKTTDHRVSLTLLSLYAAAGAPSASGLEPTETLEGFTNPCPADSPCVVDASCIEAEPTDVMFELETVFEAEQQ